MDGLHGVGMGWGVLGEEEDAGLSHFVSNPPRCLPEGPKWCGTGARPPREAEADRPLLNNPVSEGAGAACHGILKHRTVVALRLLEASLLPTWHG